MLSASGKPSARVVSFLEPESTCLEMGGEESDLAIVELRERKKIPTQ